LLNYETIKDSYSTEQCVSQGAKLVVIASDV